MLRTERLRFDKLKGCCRLAIMMRVLMDIQMPNMNGYEATEAIRKLPDERAKIPIIAMTANAFEEDRQAALAAGMDDYVAKPVEISELFRTIMKNLK